MDNKTPHILQIFAENPALMSAVREILLKYFAIEGLQPNISDELLGQAVRARLIGIKAIGNAFREIEMYKVIHNAENKDNPGY